jgi:hypothetical protein
MLRRFVLSSLIAITVTAPLHAEKKSSIVITSSSVNGSVLAIHGAGFGNATGNVSLQGQSISVNAWSDTNIAAQLPANLAAGSYLVAVSRQGKKDDGQRLRAKDTATFIVTIGAVGPAGPAGAPGAQGPPWPGPTSIDFLSGVPCNVGATAGLVSVQTAADGAITLRCVVPTLPPPAPFCLDLLQPSDALVNEALTLFTHSQDVAIASSCGGVSIACSSGNPVTASFHMNTTEVTLSPVTSGGTYPFTVTFSATTQAGIPITLTGITCLAMFDTTLTGSSTTTLSGELIFDSHTATGTGPINRVRVGSIVGLSEGLDDGDISVTGGGLCPAANLFSTTLRSVLRQSISDSMNRGACRQCGSTALGDCGSLQQ